jgi:microcystin-dependent protein
MAWDTGDVISAGYVSIRFLVPNDDWIRRALTGSMLGLLTPFSWTPVGDVDPRVAAAVFRVAWNSQQVQNTMVGQVVCFPADNMEYLQQNPINGPSQLRKCDGTFYLKSDFPDLYAVIGDTFGATMTQFAVPDMRGRVVVDAGAGTDLTPYDLGDEFGEERHELDTGEIPAHNHVIDSTFTALAVAPGELPVLTPGIFPATTGDTGGGDAHNNIQPSIALFYYIQMYP